MQVPMVCRDEETAIDGNKKAAHKAEMQRRKEKRDRCRLVTWSLKMMLKSPSSIDNGSKASKQFEEIAWRCRHLDKAGNASKDSKQDDGQTAILNFSYYDNKP